MFLVVAKKSRSFFRFPSSADVQVCGSWERAQPGSQPEPAEIFHTIDIVLSL